VSHSIFSPSSAKTILACRPSLLVPGVKGGDGDNDYTNQGTAAHDLIELCGISEHIAKDGVKPADYLGSDLHGVTVDAEMVRDAEVFLQEVRAIMEANPGADVFFERRIVHPRVPEFGGTMDCLIVTDDSLWILDFKFGMGQTVHVEDNEQLLCYIVLAIAEVGKKDYLHATVVQPRKPHTDGPVRTWSPDYETVNQFANVLTGCIQQYRERKRQQDAGTAVYLEVLEEYDPTADNCRFCAGKANCPALQGMFKEYTMETRFDSEYVARVLETEFLVRKHIDAVKIQANAEMADGKTVPGFKRTTKYGNRRWDTRETSPSDLVDIISDTLRKAGYLAKHHLFSTNKLRSPAQLEKQGIPREVFEHLVERPITGVKVVPISDYGDDIDDDAASAFEAVS